MAVHEPGGWIEPSVCPRADRHSGSDRTVRELSPTDLPPLTARRLANWGQTPATRTPDPTAATRLIERIGFATLFPASPEVPNLFHAYTGDPGTRVVTEWDSPAGNVYTWRWQLGRAEAAFYTAIVRGRPTLVSWALLPALLRLVGDLRAPDELYDRGELSAGAYRIARALDESGGVLATGELRRAAGFPTGREQRAAFLKAVAELDRRLMLAKVFAEGDEDMRHALVSARYPEAVEAADRLTRNAALYAVLATYLPAAVYAVPTPLARHLGLPEPELRAALDRAVERGTAEPARLPGQRGACYLATT